MIKGGKNGYYLSKWCTGKRREENPSYDIDARSRARPRFDGDKQRPTRSVRAALAPRVSGARMVAV
jgi:hypothetical protein